MSGWTQYREQYHRRRKAFLLLMLSGVLRPANAELPQFRESKMNGPESEAALVPPALSLPEESRWLRDIRERFFKHTRWPLPILHK